MSAMATSVDFRSSLRPRSGSFHGVTLRDDCEMTLPHSHVTNTCHLSLGFFRGEDHLCVTKPLSNMLKYLEKEDFEGE